jgi:hypothetical protein
MHMNAKHSKRAFAAIALLMLANLGGCEKGPGTSMKSFEAIVAEGTETPPRPLSSAEHAAAVDKWRAYFKVNPTKGLDVNLACADMRRPLIKAVRQAQSPSDRKLREAELFAFWERRGEIEAKCLIARFPERYMPDGWENDEGLAAAVKEWKRGREERIANEKKGDYD